ncbi:MAG: adenosylcobinamide-GDP ribazoletransferase [Pseudomonadota bacterium]
MRDHTGAFLLAVQFLTRIPIPRRVEFSESRNDLSTGYYPAVGALIGLLVTSVWWITSPFLGSSIAIVLSVIAGIVTTGAFHEDGLADTFDSFGASDKNRALEIMRDSRLGTYGVAALVSTLALKTSALLQIPPSAIPVFFIGAHTLSRFSSMMVVRTSKYVREAGTAKPVAQAIQQTPLVLMMGTVVLILSAVWLLTSAQIVGVLVAATLVGHVISRLCYEPRLGGYTGDCLGATQQITEVAIYLGGVVWLL